MQLQGRVLYHWLYEPLVVVCFFWFKLLLLQYFRFIFPFFTCNLKEGFYAPSYVFVPKLRNINARPSEHPPVGGNNAKTFRWDHRLQICSGFVFTTFVMYITTTMRDGVLHCLVFNVFLVSLHGD